jgi:ribosome modulation factor
MSQLDYTDGRQARVDGYSLEACPFGFEASTFDAPANKRQGTEMTRRHWWLAGWHDQDIEMEPEDNQMTALQPTVIELTGGDPIDYLEQRTTAAPERLEEGAKVALQPTAIEANGGDPIDYLEKRRDGSTRRKECAYDTPA